MASGYHFNCNSDTDAISETFSEISEISETSERFSDVDIAEMDARIEKLQAKLAKNNKDIQKILAYKDQVWPHIRAFDPANIIYCGIGLKVVRSKPVPNTLCLRIFVRTKEDWSKVVAEDRCIPSHIGPYDTDVEACKPPIDKT